MHVQIVTYQLNGISEEEYIDVAHDLAPRFASLPGLQAKVWLESPETETYGAVYFWDDEESMERYMASDLFEATNPDFDEVTSDWFSVLENLTEATQPVLEILHRARTAPKGVIEGRAFPAPAEVTRPEARDPKAQAKKAGKRAAAKKAPVGKAAAKKAVVKEAAARKSPAKKAPARKKAVPRGRTA